MWDCLSQQFISELSSLFAGNWPIKEVRCWQSWQCWPSSTVKHHHVSPRQLSLQSTIFIFREAFSWNKRNMRMGLMFLAHFWGIRWPPIMEQNRPCINHVHLACEQAFPFSINMWISSSKSFVTVLLVVIKTFKHTWLYDTITPPLYCWDWQQKQRWLNVRPALWRRTK